MRQFTGTCPVTYTPMFRKSQVPAQNYKNASIQDLRPFLTYEVFLTGDFPEENIEYLLRCILPEEEEQPVDPEEDEERPMTEDEHCAAFLHWILSGTSDREYEAIWRSIPMSDIPRILLYGRGDSANRLPDPKESELEWFLGVLDHYGIWYDDEDPGGVIEVRRRSGDSLMTLYPCCPCCHTILPEGWFAAEDYYPVSVVGSGAKCGKTTLMLSWFAHNMISLMPLSFYGSGVDILPGFDAASRRFPLDIDLYDEADRMRERNVYPTGTERASMPPLYLRVMNNEGRFFIVSVTENQGKEMEAWDRSAMAKSRILHAGALIYLIDPKELSDPTRQSAWKVFKHMNMLRMSGGLRGKQHISFVLSKTDTMREAIGRRDYADVLLSGTAYDRQTDEGREEVDRAAQSFFAEQIIEGATAEERELCIRLYYRDFGSVSWHCAAGMENPAVARTYRSIRAGEPLTACLIDEIDRLGWMKAEDSDTESEK